MSGPRPPVLAESVTLSTRLRPRAATAAVPFLAGAAFVAGALISMTSAYFVWSPTYQTIYMGPPPSGGCACTVHLVGWPVFMVWIIGALIPFGVLVRPRVSALLAALTGLIGLVPAGYLVWILLLWAPYPPGVAAAPGVVALLVLLLLGLGAEVCGMISFAKSASRDPKGVAVGNSASSPPAP